VYAYATGGNDVAQLVGSQAEDTLVAAPQQTRLYGADYFRRATAFDEVHAEAGEGRDTAIVYDANSAYLQPRDFGIEPDQVGGEGVVVGDWPLQIWPADSAIPSDLQQLLEGYDFEDLCLRKSPVGDDDADVAISDLALLALWE